MENLLVTRTNCNSFTFTYSDIYTDLQVDVYEVSLDNNWDGNFTGLPLYTSFTIPHIELPSIVPIVTSLSLPSDKIYVFKYTKLNYNEEIKHYIPSIYELLVLTENIPDLIPSFMDVIWSSSEADIDNIYTFTFGMGETIHPKNINGCPPGVDHHYILPISKFTLIEDTPSYAVGDNYNNSIIFEVNHMTGSHTYEYKIVTIPPIAFDDYIWVKYTNFPYLPNVLLNTEIYMYSGENNTLLLKNHIDEFNTLYNPIYSANGLTEVLPNIDYVIEHSDIVEYSLYTIFCDLIQCRLNIIKRVLGELNNCKEECDCINVYDFNAFNAIYESILNLYEDLFSILNINVTNSVISASELDKLTTLDILLQQYKKYCIECKTPCKNC